MKWELLDPESIFEKGDEWLNPNSMDWKPIPKQWIGYKYTQDGHTTTIDRMKIQVRRKTKTRQK